MKTKKELLEEYEKSNDSGFIPLEVLIDIRDTLVQMVESFNQGEIESDEQE